LAKVCELKLSVHNLHCHAGRCETATAAADGSTSSLQDAAGGSSIDACCSLRWALSQLLVLEELMVVVRGSCMLCGAVAVAAVVVAAEVVAAAACVAVQVVFRDPVRYKLQKVLTVAAEGTLLRTGVLSASGHARQRGSSRTCSSPLCGSRSICINICSGA